LLADLPIVTRNSTKSAARTARTVRGSDCVPAVALTEGTPLGVYPDAPGGQPERTPPTRPAQRNVLLFATACGTASGYIARDWQTEIEVFTVIVALLTPR
jgi:hypothetical protein